MGDALKRQTASHVLTQIESGGERFWRLADFEGMSFSAVAAALSRLSRRGVVQRVGKGIYYRPRLTAFGESRPSEAMRRSLPMPQHAVFPAGTAAANLLGFSTQNAAKIELATSSSSLPRLIIGDGTIVHIRRPHAWAELAPEDAALLDFLRTRGHARELSPEETVAKLLKLMKKEGRLTRLLSVSATEPPRVRAMLGAIAEQLGESKVQLDALRSSLNPLSRFEFGQLIALKHAKRWQAKERKNNETLRAP